jgi:putative DNA methylase
MDNNIVDDKKTLGRAVISISPQIAGQPAACCERLIDSGALYFEASSAGFSERYRRGETSHTVHVWWARRPHCAMRALVFASVCKDRSADAALLLNELVSPKISAAVLKTAKRHIAKGYKHTPKLLDMFGGGGTIPFESNLLGIDTYSIDINELSVFIQKCNMIYSKKVNLNSSSNSSSNSNLSSNSNSNSSSNSSSNSNFNFNLNLKPNLKIKTGNTLKSHAFSIEDIIKNSGQKILNALKAKTGWLFPLRKKYNDEVFGYLWTYSINCPHCSYKMFLIKRPRLAKKSKNTAFVVCNGARSQKVKIEAVPHNYNFLSVWARRGGSVKCPGCNKTIGDLNIKNCEDELIALIQKKSAAGKLFLPAEDNALPALKEIKKTENKLLKKMGCKLPESKLPRWSGIVNPSLYGVDTHADFLNPRQRLLLLYLIDELCAEYDSLLQRLGADIAKFVTGLLSALIDQLIDWNCRLSMWIAQNEQVGRSFCGPGIAMLWDYAETDPLLNGPANLYDKLDRIIAGVKSFAAAGDCGCDSGRDRAVNSVKGSAKGCGVDCDKENINTAGVHIQLAQAQKLPFRASFFDAIVTDPPYYDNIFYSALADFFYAWKRLLLIKIEPELFAKPATDNNDELVASSFRSETPGHAHRKYCAELEKAINEGARVLKTTGVMSLVYSHSSINGWLALIQAFRNSPFVITSVQPLNIERKQRPRAVSSAAVNTCITFICRKSKLEKSETKIGDLKSKLNEIIREFCLPLVKKDNWSQQDIALASFANAVGMISNSKKITGVSDDAAAIKIIAADIKKIFPSFNMKLRSLI